MRAPRATVAELLRALGRAGSVALSSTSAATPSHNVPVNTAESGFSTNSGTNLGAVNPRSMHAEASPQLNQGGRGYRRCSSAVMECQALSTSALVDRQLVRVWTRSSLVGHFSTLTAWAFGTGFEGPVSLTAIPNKTARDGSASPLAAALVIWAISLQRRSASSHRSIACSKATRPGDSAILFPQYDSRVPGAALTLPRPGMLVTWRTALSWIRRTFRCVPVPDRFSL